MSKFFTVGLDLAKNVFQVHGADGVGRAVLRKKLRRAQVLEFFSQLPSCVVARSPIWTPRSPIAPRRMRWLAV